MPVSFSVDTDIVTCRRLTHGLAEVLAGLASGLTNLEDIRARIPPELVAVLDAELAPIDTRFRAQTEEIPTERGIFGRSGWWWRSLPRSAPRARRPLQSYYFRDLKPDMEPEPTGPPPPPYRRARPKSESGGGAQS